MIKKMITSLAGICIAMCLFSVIVQAEVLQEGDYRYQVLEDGTAELTDYTGSDTEVMIPGTIGGYTVTSIGDHLFNFYYELEYVSIPESVKHIGDSAFASCGYVQEFILPKNLETISDGAFAACYGISDIELPETLKSIGECAFLRCINLSSITIPKNVEFIGNNAFDDCTKLEYIEVTEDNPVFSSKEGVLFNKDKSVLLFYPLMKEGSTYTIPESVKTIGYACFNDCDNLTDMVIPETVTSIEAYAFRDCDNITSITIPNSITSISEYVFWNCAGLEVLNLHEELESIGAKAFSSCNSLRTIILPEGVKKIAGGAFSSCENLENVYVPKSIESIAGGAFSGISDGRKTFYAGSEEEWAFLDDVITNNLSESSSDLYCNVFYPEDDGFLCQSTGDATAAIVQYVGTNPDAVTPTVIKNHNITSISDYACHENLYLNSIVISEGVTSIGVHAFSRCDNLSKVILPDTLKRIDGVAFGGIGITEINLPEGLESIGATAFSGCDNLKSIVFPDNVTKVPACGFSGCDRLERVVLPDGITSIGSMAFENCTNLVNINIPSEVNYIGPRAFYACSNLHSISIPEGVTEIGNDAFRNCSALEKIKLSEGIEVIYCSAFSGCCSLKKAVLPSTLKEFSYKVFEGCTSLQAVEIPNTLTEIGGNAFSGCTSLTDVYYTGTEEEWTNMSILDGNDALKNATIHYESHMPFFEDVSSTDWFYDAIDYVCENEFMIGLNETTFAPFDTLTRAQFALILYRMNGAPEVTYSPVFSDIEEGAWYEDAVLWAYNNNIVSGYNNGTFGPFDTITREQMVVMMYRYAASQSQDTSTSGDISIYADAYKVSPYAQDAMKWAVGNSIIGANGAASELNPQGKTMRGECAVIIQRFMGI